MDRRKLEIVGAYIDRQLAESSAKGAALWTDAETGEVYYAHHPDTQVVSASIIKTPLMLSLLEQVRQGELDLQQMVPVPREEILADTTVFDLGQTQYPLWELIYWMIVLSDNTATNVLIQLHGMDRMNRYVADLGCRETTLQRKMLDFGAVAAGRQNYTSPRDMDLLHRLLLGREILTPALCDWAMGILLRQRCFSQFLRYIPDEVAVAHKTGGLDHLNHDCGLFLLPQSPYFLGVFLWDTPDIGGDKPLVGRISKAIYDLYREDPV